MSVRKCGTCKHYEPAPIWRKGWCRNPLLYSPQQSHLVGEDDLDCDRGMGNYWEPIEQSGTIRSNPAGGYGYIAPRDEGYDEPSVDADNDDAAHPGISTGHDGNGESARRGGPVSQFGGPGRPGSPGGFGDGGEEDRGTAPFNEADGQDADRYGSGGSFDYQMEERYWTDYLRIAAPVLGVILMLGLVWFWLVGLLGSDDDEVDVTPTPDVSGPVIFDDDPDDADDTDADNGAIPVATPDVDDDANGDAPTAIGPGASVVVSGTGDEGLNVRAGPGTDSDVQGQVSEGTALTITGESVEGEDFTWWPVEGDGITGYVVEDFISLAD